MSSTVNITYEGEYISVQLTGENSYAVSLNLWEEAVEACEKHQCFNIIGISNTTNPLKTMDAYNHIKIFKQVGLTHKYRIAWVEKDPEAANAFRFIETVVKNRGIATGHLFSDLSVAKNWLLGHPENPPGS